MLNVSAAGRVPAAVLLLLAGSLTGCASYFRQPANVEATKAEVETMRRDQTELLALVRELKLRVEGLSEDTASMRADQNLQLRQLESKLDILTAQLEEQGVRFERMQRRDTRPPTPPDTTQATKAGSAAPPGASAEALFETAQRDYARGNYQLAIAGFQDYLSQAPESDRADNAQYWVGECYYSLGDLDRAVQEFLKVRDLYPASDAVCIATYKIGLAFVRKNDTATAKRYFETVTRECPDTSEAGLAKDKLQTLN